MKRIFCYLLVVFMICLAFSGCDTAQEASQATKQTASEALEALFTTVDLMDATVADLQAEMEAGHVTSEQLTQMYIDRIEAYDEKLGLNSIIALNPAAPEDARKLDQERAEGNVRGPLHGIPVVVKANLDIADMATSTGASILADLVATEDAFAVKKLKEAGAVILAQANMSEFAFSAVSSRSTLGGYVHNAYDATRTPGGSSGGTAVAVTSNFAAVGVGTDTGGSIRNPSSFANLYGIRPSKGLTSISGVFPLKAYKDTVGPMARTAEDLALMLEVLAGTDNADDYTVEADADALLGEGYTKSLTADALKGMRIGYLDSSWGYSAFRGEEYIYMTPDRKIEGMFNKTLANLRKAGAQIVNLSEALSAEMIQKISKGMETNTFEFDANKFLHEKGDAAPYQTVKAMTDTGTGGVQYINLNWALMGLGELAPSFEKTKNPYTETVGAYQRLPDWQKALKGRATISKIMKENDVDAVMYLNFFDVPGEESGDVNVVYNPSEYDLTFGPKLGLPEISIPMGFSGTDKNCKTPLPLGLSVFADFGQEKTLLQLAYAYEQQAGASIRQMSALTPALEDAALAGFLKDLIIKAYSVEDSYSFIKKPEGELQLMLSACEKAKAVDTKDPYATYEAAKTLAEAYDRVIATSVG